MLPSTIFFYPDIRHHDPAIPSAAVQDSRAGDYRRLAEDANSLLAIEIVLR
jgi:hypothetical protein